MLGVVDGMKLGFKVGMYDGVVECIFVGGVVLGTKDGYVE